MREARHRALMALLRAARATALALALALALVLVLAQRRVAVPVLAFVQRRVAVPVLAFVQRQVAVPLSAQHAFARGNPAAPTGAYLNATLLR